MDLPFADDLLQILHSLWVIETELDSPIVGVMVEFLLVVGAVHRRRFAGGGWFGREVSC